MKPKNVVIPAEAGIQCRQSPWTPAFAGVTIGLAMAAFLCYPSGAEDPLAENQSRIGKVTGTAEVMPQGAVGWSEIRTDMPLETGDQIRTGDDGEVELAISERALWILQNNTEVIVGHTTGSESRISIRRGTLLGRADSTGGYVGNWQFETPAAVCAVRGTEFALAHSDDDGTRLAVAQGTVEMEMADAASEDITASVMPRRVLVHANEEGFLKRRTHPTVGPWSPMMQPHVRRIPVVRRRLRETSAVWSPHTTGYRRELRGKLAPPAVKRHPKPIRQAPQPRRRERPH